MKGFNFDYEGSNMYRKDNGNYFDKSINEEINEKMNKEDFSINYPNFINSNSNYYHGIYNNDNYNNNHYYKKETDSECNINNKTDFSFNYNNNLNEIKGNNDFEKRIIYLEKKLMNLKK